MAAVKRVSGLRRALDKAERELEAYAERERQRTAREEALLTRLCLLEGAYKELQKELLRAQANGKVRSAGMHGRFARSPARLVRPAKVGASDSTGVVTVATRLARGGHSRDEVQNFLRENFCQIDVNSTLETAFATTAETGSPAKAEPKAEPAKA